MTVRYRKSAGRLATFGLAVFIGGCVAPQTPPASDTSTTQSGEKAGSDGAVASTAPATEPVDKPDIAVPTPEKLIGMSRAEIVTLLGQPDFRRHDVPALLMRYRDKRCILDFFLYPPAGPRSADGPKVEHLEARGTDGSRIATGACIESVMKSRSEKKAG